MGLDRPSPDHANAEVILLICAHLEAGHYFNPHAQRVTEARERGAKLIVFDTRLSNTATHADHWVAPIPGSEAAILLAIARHVLVTGRHDREFVRRWWNWQEYLRARAPGGGPDLRALRGHPARAVLRLHVRVRRSASRASAANTLRAVAELVAGAGTRALNAHLALGRRRQPRRLAGLALPVPAQRAARRGRHRGRRVPEHVEQVRPAADPRPRPSRHLERADVAAGVPAGHERDVVPAAAPAQGAARPASTSTSPASTTRSGPTPTASRGSRP